MPRLALILVAPLAVVAAAGAAVVAFRRNPRIGSGFMNTVVNPALLQRGLVGGAASELGTIEHVGRTSRLRRLTPVHPEPTADGFRIMVPLGTHSHWAQNVMAAGHCRLQLHDTVYELDEPAIVAAADADGLPPFARRFLDALGFQYLRLRTFAQTAGSLEPVGAAPDKAAAAGEGGAGPAQGAPVPGAGEPAPAAG